MLMGLKRCLRKRTSQLIVIDDVLSTGWSLNTKVSILCMHIIHYFANFKVELFTSLYIVVICLIQSTTHIVFWFRWRLHRQAIFETDICEKVVNKLLKKMYFIYLVKYRPQYPVSSNDVRTCLII